MTDTSANPETNIQMDALIEIARAASEEVLAVYGKEDFSIETKDDQSPLTEADRRSNAVILEGLASRYPEIPVISEETQATPYDERRHWETFWLVDPLDGTKEFIKRNGEFTVNIALVRNRTPVLGVVARPVTGTLYFARAGEGSFRLEPDGARTRLENSMHYSTEQSVTVVASRSHLTDAVLEFVEKLKAGGKDVEFVSAGSSLKLCLVAEGKATVYPRFGPTMEWDTAAAHAVAACAGKRVLNHETGQPLEYNKENLLNPWFIVE